MVAAMKMTARAAMEIFMVPEAEAVGDRCVVSGSSAGMLCSSARPFIGSQGSNSSIHPPPLQTGGVSTANSKHWLLSQMKTDKLEKKTEIIFASMTLPLTSPDDLSAHSLAQAQWWEGTSSSSASSDLPSQAGAPQIAGTRCLKASGGQLVIIKPLVFTWQLPKF